MGKEDWLANAIWVPNITQLGTYKVMCVAQFQHDRRDRSSSAQTPTYDPLIRLRKGVLYVSLIKRSRHVSQHEKTMSWEEGKKLWNFGQLKLDVGEPILRCI